MFAGTRHASTAALEESVSLTQHHDAITGTAKQHVVNDYHKQLSKGAPARVSRGIRGRAAQTAREWGGKAREQPGG